MKYLILILTTISIWTSLSAQTLEERITDKMCDCFKAIDKSIGRDNILNKYTEDCLLQALKYFEPELTKIQDTIQGQTDYQKGLELGKTMGVKTQSLMIQRCDQFFYFMENVKKEMFTTTDIESEKQNILNRTKQINTSNSNQDYFERAMSYYKIKEFKSAKKDLDRLISLDKNHVQGLLLRGFAYEQTKKYKKAIVDFKECKRLTGKSEIDIFIAMAERKSID
jgi:tetratricopeptide (TPR) repeat protein